MKTGKFLLVVLSVGLFFLWAPDVLAHEKRKVAGKYDFVVGFVNEPAFSGALNALDLRISENEKPVEGLEETLKATVLFGKESMPLTLKKRYKEPGKYAGYFFPSVPGDYSFRIEGEIKGEKIDEVFTPGEKFHAIGDPESLKFPKKGV